MDKKKEFIGIGRRKRAVASVRIRKGKGNIDVNKRKFEEYFPSEILQDSILSPLVKFLDPKGYDIIIRTKGGGISAQSEAVRLGISRALVEKDESLKSKLKDLGFLTRDPRKKERKKYGLAKARKSFQFSKR